MDTMRAYLNSRQSLQRPSTSHASRPDMSTAVETVTEHSTSALAVSDGVEDDYRGARGAEEPAAQATEEPSAQAIEKPVAQATEEVSAKGKSRLPPPPLLLPPPPSGSLLPFFFLQLAADCSVFLFREVKL